MYLGLVGGTMIGRGPPSWTGRLNTTGVVSRLKCHYLAEVYKMVKWVLKAIIHSKLWQGKVRQGLLVQDG